MAFPFLYLALAIGGGILLASFFSLPLSLLVLCLFLFLCGAWISYALVNNLKITFFFVILTTYILGACLYSHAYKSYEENSLHRLEASDYIDFTGTLYKSPTPGLNKDYLYLMVSKVSFQDREEKIKGNLRVSVLHASEQSRPIDLLVHDKIKVSARLSPMTTYQNFNRNAQSRYYQFLNIHNRASTKTPLLIEKIAEKKPLSPLRLISYLRRGLLDKIEQHFPPSDDQPLAPQGAILEALLLGERGRLDESITSALQASGIYHLFAISGAHIAIVSFFFFSLLRVIKIPSRTAHVLLLVFLIFYALLVEGRPSVIRATIMTIAFIVGKIFWKDVNLINTLSISAFILLFFNPFNMFSLGFQLTFAATLSIILFFPKIIPYLPRLPLRLSEIFAITVTAQLGVLPFLAASFNRITFSSLILNYVALPLVALIMAGGYVFLPLAFVNHWSAQMLAKALICCTDILISISQTFSNISFLSYRIPTPHLLTIIGYFAFLLFFLVPVRFKRQRLINTAAFLLFSVLLISYPFSAKSKTLTVTFIDVGQGDSILIEFPGQKKMLVDGGGVRDGTFDIGEKVVSPLLWRKGIKRIDTLVLTHPEADHMNGLRSVARNFKLVEFWQADVSPDIGRLVDFKKTFPPRLYVRKLLAEESLSIGEVKLEILHPRNTEFTEVSSPNNSSLVIRLAYGKTSFLLTGDIEAYAEQEILDHFVLKKTQVLKSPHHGSSSSSSMEFLAAISPQIVVVSAGRNNPYNLPSPRVLERYHQIEAKVYRTDVHGAVEISSDGEKISVRTSSGIID
jgi:competence protein ComEC